MALADFYRKWRLKSVRHEGYILSVAKKKKKKEKKMNSWHQNFKETEVLCCVGDTRSFSFANSNEIDTDLERST